MGEVSPKLMDDTLAHLRASGLDVEPLIFGLPVARDARGASTAAVDWDTYLTLLDRAQVALGGAAAMLRNNEAYAGTRPGWSDLLASITDPSDFFALAWGTLFRNLYPHLEVRYEPEPVSESMPVPLPAPARGARMVLHVPEPYRATDAFVDGALGLARGLLRVARADPDAARVERQPRGWTLSFTLPPPHAVPAAPAEPRDETVEALADALTQLLVARCGAGRVALWLADRDGVLHALRDPGPGFVHAHARELRAFGRLVGRVEFDLAPGCAAGDDALFEALLPWAASALEGARRAADAEAYRVRAEHELWARARSEAALLAATELLPGPAFMVDPAGRVEAANSAGQSELAHDAAGVEAKLRDVVAGREDGHAWEIRSLPRGPLEGHRLVIRRDVAWEVARRMPRVAESWGLTVRQQEVLAQLVRGRTNKEIAQELACADNTVEFHITQILRKAGVENRSALVAVFWAGG